LTWLAVGKTPYVKSDDLGGSQEPEGLGSSGRHFDDDSEFDKPKVISKCVE
jgi:hypothetical protein